MKSKYLALKPLLAIAIGVGLVGCNSLNDNPTSPEMMHNIRNKEAQGRANFNPNAAPPAQK